MDYGIRDVYDYGVDGQFSFVVSRNGRLVVSGYPLDYQAKVTVNWSSLDEHIIYDLEAKTYNDMVSRTPSETTLILILLCLPKSQTEWHGTCADETVLRHCCYWHIVSGELTSNTSKVRIRIPSTNVLTPATLNELLASEKARRQSQVL